MGSERVYRLSAEILLGRPARSYAELDLIDLSVSSFGSFYKISGFGGTKSFRKGCAHISRSLTTFPRNLLETRCFALWGTRGSDVTPASKLHVNSHYSSNPSRLLNTLFPLTGSAVDSIVWTDNENAVLIVPCNHESNTLDWFVLTKRTTFSDEVKENVLSHITKLGFNPQNAVYYDYENKRIIRKISSPPVQNYQWPTFNEFKAPTHKIHQPIQSSYSSPTVNEIKAPIPSHTIHPPLLSSYTPYYTVPSSYYTF